MAGWHASKLDDSPELIPKLALRYQSLIGILHWMVRLGRADTKVEVSTKAFHMALPHEGHLITVYHVFSYLKALTTHN